MAIRIGRDRAAGADEQQRQRHFLGFLGKLSPSSAHLNIDLTEFEVPDVDLPEFLKIEDAWSIELDIHPVDAPGLMHKSVINSMGFFGSSKKMRTGTINLVDIEGVDTVDEVRDR